MSECAEDDIYAVTHMTNKIEAVDFALNRGANALELDLQFDSMGEPTEFTHGSGLCDCSCLTGETCNTFPDLCRAATAATKMLRYLGNQEGIALIIIDSKISSSTPQISAGHLLVEELEDYLFNTTYQGDVIISVATTQSAAFLSSAAEAADKSQFSDRIHFTFDGEDKEVIRPLEYLIGISQNRVYGTGISACYPRNFQKAIQLARKNEDAGVIGLTYIWTLDKESSMRTYLQEGARGILTNSPQRLNDVIKITGRQLAAPGCRIPAATSDEIIRNISLQNSEIIKN